MIGVMMGCLCMNIFWRYGSSLNNNQRTLAVSLLQSSKMYIRFWECSVSCLSVIIYVLLLIASFTAIGNVFARGFSFSMGIWCGATGTQCMIAKGIHFLFVIARLLFPEVLLYIAAYVLLSLFGYRMYKRLINGKKYKTKSSFKLWSPLVFSVICFLLWGICLFYVNFLK